MRLVRGDFARETVYDTDPVAVARRYADEGARWIHVVDLDAARTGSLVHLRAIERICASVGCLVQAGGGVRDLESAGALLDAGVARVVVGTAAITRPELVDQLVVAHPGRVAVGLDARGREVAVRGWTEGTGEDLVAALTRLSEHPVAAVVVTDIGRDGTLAGPDRRGLAEILAATATPVVASGGVGSLADLRSLADLTVEGRQLAGVIVGRALYEGAFTLADALRTVGG